jgi:hypothetical protein
MSYEKRVEADVSDLIADGGSTKEYLSRARYDRKFVDSTPRNILMQRTIRYTGHPITDLIADGGSTKEYLSRARYDRKFVDSTPRNILIQRTIRYTGHPITTG